MKVLVVGTAVMGQMDTRYKSKEYSSRKERTVTKVTGEPSFFLPFIQTTIIVM
jgi:hypothetical protein